VKSVFVTGADGEVGKRLVARLVKDGLTVTAFVRSDKEKSFFNSIQVKTVVGETQNSKLVEEALTGQDAVIHLIGTFQSENETSLDTVNNLSTYDIHTAAQEKGIQKFIFLSAYGASLGVKNLFLVSKGNAEVDIMQGEIPYVILRCTPIYSESNVLGLLLKQLIQQKKVPLIGSGQQKLQPIYIDDVVEYLVQALIDPKARQQVLEIGGPDQVTYEDLMKTAGEVVGKVVQFSHTPSFLKSILSPVKLNGNSLPPELLDFFSRDSFVSKERTDSVLPISLTPLREGLKNLFDFKENSN